MRFELSWHINCRRFARVIRLVVLEYVEWVREVPLNIPFAQELSLGLVQHCLNILIQEPAEIADSLLPLPIEVVVHIVTNVDQQLFHVIQRPGVHFKQNALEVNAGLVDEGRRHHLVRVVGVCRSVVAKVEEIDD